MASTGDDGVTPIEVLASSAEPRVRPRPRPRDEELGPGRVQHAGWLARVGASPIEPLCVVMGWSERVAMDHVRRLVAPRSAWLCAWLRVRGRSYWTDRQIGDDLAFWERQVTYKDHRGISRVAHRPDPGVRWGDKPAAIELELIGKTPSGSSSTRPAKAPSNARPSAWTQKLG